MHEDFRILVVDDNVPMLEAVVRVLSAAGYQTMQARTGEEAWAIFKRERPQLVIMDVVLPDADGVELCRRMKADPEAVGVLVILLSGMRVSPESQVFGLESGADGYIVRPIGNRELLARVEAYARLSRAQAQLRESQARFRSLFDHLLDGAALHEIITDANGVPVDYVFLEANPAFERHAGIRPQDIIGRRATEVVPGIDQTPLIEIYGRVALTGQAIVLEQYVEPLGKYFEISAFSTQPGQFAAVFRDITERKKAEQERERLIAELQRALEQVKTLSGLLPICASCKKIRDDQGYWHEVEEYIHTHADVDFSHSICPSCARKLYPELYGTEEDTDEDMEEE